MIKIQLESETQTLHKIYSAVNRAQEVKPHNYSNFENILRIFHRDNKVLCESYGLHTRAFMLQHNRSTPQFLATLSSTIEVFKKVILIGVLDNRVPFTKRKQIVDTCWQIIKNETRKELQQTMIQTLAKLDDSKRQDLLNLLSSSSFPVKSDLHKVIDVLSKLSHEDIRNLFSSYGPLFSEVIDSHMFCSIAKAMVNVSSTKRKQVLLSCVTFIANMGIQPEQRPEVIWIASQIKTFDLSQFFQIIEKITCNLVDRSDRKDIVEHLIHKIGLHKGPLLFAASPLFIHVKSFHDANKLIAYVLNLSLDDLRQSVDLLSRINHTLDVFDLIDYMLFFLQNDPSIRQDLFDQLYPLIDSDMESRQKFMILYGLQNFPKNTLFEVIPEIISLLDDIPELSTRFDLFAVLLDNAPHFIEPLHKNLTLLLNEETDQHSAKRLAKEIFNNRDLIYAEDDSELINQAIAIMTVASNINDRKNPYKIFKKHISMSKRMFTVPLPACDISSELYTINAEFLKSRHVSNIPDEELLRVCKGQRFSSQDLILIVDKMKERIESLEEPTKQAIYQHVKGMTQLGNFLLDYQAHPEVVFNHLCANIKSPFFVDVLDRPHGRECGITKAHLMALLCFFNDLSVEVPSDGLLSPQEEAVLYMSESIKNCNSGKAESLAVAYKILPQSYKYECCGDDIPVVARARDVIDQNISSLILDMFSSEEPLLQDILESQGPLAQLAHHSLYLKNRLASFVGLSHTIQFDLHTEVLRNKLVDKDISFLLQIFYKYFTVDRLVQLVQKVYDDSKQSDSLYDGFSKLITNSSNMSDIWEVSEEPPYKVKLTKNGAVQLLLESGYVKKYAKRPRRV